MRCNSSQQLVLTRPEKQVFSPTTTIDVIEYWLSLIWADEFEWWCSKILDSWTNNLNTELTLLECGGVRYSPCFSRTVNNSRWRCGPRCGTVWDQQLFVMVHFNKKCQSNLYWSYLTESKLVNWPKDRVQYWGRRPDPRSSSGIPAPLSKSFTAEPAGTAWRKHYFSSIHQKHKFKRAHAKKKVHAVHRSNTLYLSEPTPKSVVVLTSLHHQQKLLGISMPRSLVVSAIHFTLSQEFHSRPCICHCFQSCTCFSSAYRWGSEYIKRSAYGGVRDSIENM